MCGPNSFFLCVCVCGCVRKGGSGRLRPQGGGEGGEEGGAADKSASGILACRNCRRGERGMTNKQYI